MLKINTSDVSFLLLSLPLLPINFRETFSILIIVSWLVSQRFFLKKLIVSAFRNLFLKVFERSTRVVKTRYFVTEEHCPVCSLSLVMNSHAKLPAPFNCDQPVHISVHDTQPPNRTSTATTALVSRGFVPPQRTISVFRREQRQMLDDMTFQYLLILQLLLQCAQTILTVSFGDA
jgi:hypothetical protein